jgi:hypothetical protein
MNTVDRKKELILERETDFANAVGAAVFEKPKVSFWMVLIPILFLYFIYRMQKYKNGRRQFDAQFMATRRRAMDLAVEALETDTGPDIDGAVRESGIAIVLEKPYASWLRVLVEYYRDLLSAAGNSFESLVHSAYRDRSHYLLCLNRLTETEKNFYSALKPQLAAVEGASEIIAAIETQSQLLRRKLAEQIFA